MIYENNMLVSFPRSGHHALVNALKIYFGSRLKYCDPYKDKPGDWNLLKSHDFACGEPLIRGYRYIVLVRNPIHSICSRLDQMRREGNTSLVPGSESERVEFRAQLDYFNRFVHKWVASPVENRVVVSYEKLVSAPAFALHGVIQHMAQSEEMNYQALADAAETINKWNTPGYGQRLFNLA